MKTKEDNHHAEHNSYKPSSSLTSSSTVSRSSYSSTNELVTSKSPLQVEGPFRTRLLTQILAAIVIYLGPISFGCVVGYSSPALNDLEKPGRSIHLNEQENSLFASLATLGALIGGLLSGVFIDFFGRKFSIIFINIPFVIGWMLIVYSNQVPNGHIPMIYAGRTITGMCMGMVSMACPVYLSEISSPEIRGILGSGVQLFVCVGILFAYSFGSILNWTYLALLCSTVSVALMILMIPLPESPVWLLRQKRKEEALDSLVWLRGKHADVQSECDAMCNSMHNETKMSFSDFRRPDLWKPFVIMVLEMFFQQFSGCNAFMFNAANIFKSATDAIDPNTSSIIMVITGIIAVIASLFFIDKAGRRILLMISGAGSAISLFVLGGYYYVKYTNEALADSVSWLPLLCLIGFVVIFNLGFGPIPWLMMGEVFPSQARGTASSIITAVNWASAFIVTKTFINLQNAILDHGVFWSYSAICALSVPFVWKFVPETKGKTLEEIQKQFTLS